MTDVLHPRSQAGREGRVSQTAGGLFTVCRADLASDLRDIYASSTWAFDLLLAQPDARTLSGRRVLVAADIGGVPVLVKRLFHGGMLRNLTGDRFLTAKRLRNHLAAADFLADHGVATPETLFVSWRRLRGTVRGEIGVRYIADAVDASAYLFSNVTAPPEDWRQRIANLGEMVATLHRLGVLHGDLNLRNFLFLPDGEVSILDLDKANRRRQPLSADQRRRNLHRLERSLRKQGRTAPPATVSAMVVVLHSAYRTAHA